MEEAEAPPLEWNDESESHRDENACDDGHDPVDAAGEQRDWGDLDDEHRGQWCEKRLVPRKNSVATT